MAVNEIGTVLVTGGAGYIGSHAVLALRDLGYKVAVVDNLATGFRWAVPDDISFHEGDIADVAMMRGILAEENVGAIMHFAGSLIVPESVEKPLLYYENNTARTRTLVELAIEAGVKHFIFSSTAATYGMTDVPLVSETTPQLPINPYGWSKLMSEIILRDACAVHDLNHCVLRYFNVAGADPLARTGLSAHGATHLIKVATEAALGKRGHVDIFGTDYATADGTGVRDYIHVSDLAAAHVLALQALAAAPERDLTLNCGYGRGFSVREVLDAVERVSGQPIERRELPRRPGDAGMVVADNTRILETLRWAPQHADLDTIIEHALTWERTLADMRRNDL